jgi:import inner membrane translocase subunit TIM21
MNPTTNLLVTRSTAFRSVPTTLRPFLASRYYATQQGLGATAQGPKRRAVTPFNDNGHVPWKQLSAAEKAARATQQSFNFGMILVGLVLTVSTGASKLCGIGA